MKFEDFKIGDIFRTEPSRISMEDVLEFAAEYDPHYLHTDSVKAKKSIFGSLVASGMHTLAILNRQWVRLGVLQEDMVCGLGIDARWAAPVFPGDTIRCEIEVLEKKERDETSGVVMFEFTAFNQNSVICTKVKVRIIVAREYTDVACPTHGRVSDYC